MTGSRHVHRRCSTAAYLSSAWRTRRARRIATAPPTGLNPNWVRSSGGMVLGAALRRGAAVGLLLAARARNGPAPAAHHPRKHLAGAAGEYAPRDVRRLARDAVDPTRFRKLPPPWRGLPRREWARGRARHVYGGAAPQGRGGRVDMKKKIGRTSDSYCRFLLSC